MSAATNRCGLCGITRRQHDELWVGLVPHRWTPPTVAQILARQQRAIPGQRDRRAL
ncbi:hypothetical protein [Kitasatospora phosalacinea]|uniref:Uncharacterized protein n=1 Tax=Kitasatospora phosalacinea TaxID=2065 RepID=A0ABW6GS27_9ACTN